MGEPAESGVTFTPKTLSILLGIITLVGVVFSGITTVNSYAFRIETIETARVEDKARIEQITDQIRVVNKELSNNIDNLNRQIVSLTITLNRLEERMNVMRETQK